MSFKYLIVVTGPTGIGKTRTAIEIAKHFSAGIISADSRQVYKELRIGTAVPSPEELAAVKHHLIQYIPVRDYYNASMFEEDAIGCTDQLFKTNNVALLAGGSGLYIDAVCKGIDDVPAVDREIRANLMERFRKEGIESLRFELKRLDPGYYNTVDLKNTNRVLKGLEISMMTGKPYSSFLTNKNKKRKFEIIRIGLKMERSELYRRINDRVDQMMEMGLLDEVRKNESNRDCNALKTVGYRELFSYLDGEITLEKAVELIKRNSRHYARRQITWFNRDNEIQWFDAGSSAEIITYIENQIKLQQERH